jgi:ABC-2 type transport system permease protein
MFPFRGHARLGPERSAAILPLTHFLRIVRGILLKGNGIAEILPEVWPLALFFLAAFTLGMKRYRQTLD